MKKNKKQKKQIIDNDKFTKAIIDWQDSGEERVSEEIGQYLLKMCKFFTLKYKNEYKNRNLDFDAISYQTTVRIITSGVRLYDRNRGKCMNYFWRIFMNELTAHRNKHIKRKNDWIMYIYSVCDNETIYGKKTIEDHQCNYDPENEQKN